MYEIVSAESGHERQLLRLAANSTAALEHKHLYNMAFLFNQRTILSEPWAKTDR